MDSPRRKAAVVVLLGAVLAVGFWLRYDAFWLPHWKGDQNHYIALAMKLDKLGLDHYNLREVKLGSKVVSQEPPVELVFLRPGPRGSEGDIVQALKTVGQSYYDEPLHYRAPLLPYLLMISHRLLTPANSLYASCYSNLGERVRSIKPEIVFKTQFWAAIVPMLFNFGVILMTFVWGWRLYNARVALWSALLMAVNPVGITLAHRILTEDVLTFFISLSLLLYYSYFGNKKYFGWVAAGVAGGLAVLAKQTAGLLLPIICLYTFFSRYRKQNKWAAFLSPEPVAYGLAALCVSGFWFVKVWQVFGNPLHQPSTALAAFGADKTGWFYTVNLRSAPPIFFSKDVVLLVPFFAFALLTLGRFYRQVIGSFSRSEPSYKNPETLLWLWVLAFYLFASEPWNVSSFSAGQEHRFFYMAYPALAVLSASAADVIGKGISEKIGRRYITDIVLTALICWGAYAGIEKAMQTIFSNNMLF